MIIRIKNLRLRAIIGTHDWERTRPQEIILNLEMEFDGSRAAATDDLRHAVDYSAIKHRLMERVEATQFLLLEKLVEHVLDLVMEDLRITAATAEIDKPHALRFADSVSVTSSRRR